MPADHLSTTSRTPAPADLASAVRAVLAGADPATIAAQHDLDPGDLDDATRVYQAAGLAALEAQHEDSWYRVRIQFADWSAAEAVATTALGSALGRRPFPDEVAQALADEENLRTLASEYDPNDRGARDVWETIVYTGRRCMEVVAVSFDCVERYNGLPLLWHDQTKVRVRPGRTGLDQPIRARFPTPQVSPPQRWADLWDS